MGLDDMDDIQYRTMQDDDADPAQMARVFSTAFKIPVNGEEYKKRFKGHDPIDFSSQFVATHGGTIVGGVRADRVIMYFHGPDGTLKKHECGVINDVATDPRYRRRGISRALLRMALARMESKNFAISVLQADPKYHARVLYESEGFEVLPSTADVYFVRLGQARTAWAYYPVLSLIFPLLLRLAPRFAPQPPARCLDAISSMHDRNAGKKTSQRAGNVGMILVRGLADASCDWINAWRDGVSDDMRDVQGTTEQLRARALLDPPEHRPFADRITALYKRNRRFNSFVESGGSHCNTILVKEGMQGTHVLEASAIDGKGIVGGMQYTVEFFQRGRLKVFLPVIDVAWVARDHRGHGVGAAMLHTASAMLGQHFPFVLCKASSGNVPFGRATLSAGFKRVAAGITMVKPLKDKDLFNRLASNVEPWVL